MNPFKGPTLFCTYRIPRSRICWLEQARIWTASMADNCGEIFWFGGICLGGRSAVSRPNWDTNPRHHSIITGHTCLHDYCKYLFIIYTIIHTESIKFIQEKLLKREKNTITSSKFSLEIFGSFISQIMGMATLLNHFKKVWFNWLLNECRPLNLYAEIFFAGTSYNSKHIFSFKRKIHCGNILLGLNFSLNLSLIFASIKFQIYF